MGKKAAIKKPTTVAEFVKLLNSEYKGNVASGAGIRSIINNYARFSSGILGLDEALGGGWPFGRICLLAGEFSTGKTELAIQACISVQNYDHVTKKHRLLLGESQPFTPGRAMYVDAENAFDLAWAESKGFDSSHHVMINPENAEQVIDVVSRGVEENLFDLIIIDSIAQMVPQAEVENSSEDWQMGLAARLNNKAFRKWNGLLAGKFKSGHPGPMILCLNQIRLKIGVMFGDPRTLPGGKGQEFNSSVTVYTKSAKYDAKDESSMANVVMSGITHKNKTYTPKQTYTFSMAVKDNGTKQAGELDNIDQLVKRGKDLKLLQNKSGKLLFGGKDLGMTEATFRAKLKSSDAFRFKLWRSILVKSTGAEV